ncbi:hypothetical protein yc1106_09820 [Curvularia clavata]|uniref:Uncharacterized protein n=1 Tax=Curvularia clavata TaxID=95742 RepID=A0A9Q8ZIA5_CURCL|nr:hypothetical protein yc1106_09820 [Curvularia clavata]
MSNASFYDFHCPLGGSWYACTTGSNFVGCCTSNPCSSSGCFQGNVRAGAFNKTQWGNFPDASCGAASNFWSCTAGDSFWGCCKSNPCNATTPATCPSGDLTPAFLDRPDLVEAYTSTGKEDDSGKTNTGAIVGGVVGGVVVIAIIAVIFFVLRRRKNKKAAGGDMGAATMMPMMNKEKGDQGGAAGQYGGQSRMPVQSLHGLLNKLTLGTAPPTYSGPVQNTYQASSPGKGHESYHQYASHASEPQELPAELASPHGQRFSELPAGASNVMDNRRFSELPAEGAGPAGPSELESPYTTPYVTPQPLQGEFSNDMAKRSSPQGLGLSTGK